ncbi:cytochrome P450 1A1-like [Tachyglossus aculeatus]|uniref:cytochrome P450 1A1-like n=1 Tax=Tachyglossus aculeatus TaxID=9261 RepID=UPI0018F56EEE|nr:cytochrome P450 1A1-like [Tachyglossus aculeatus]
MAVSLSVLGWVGSASVTEILLASTVFCLVFWIIASIGEKVPPGLKSPPGPWAWPLIGNTLELRKDPHLTLTRMSQIYGDVMQVQIGTTPVLVLSGLGTIRQALVKQGEDFMGRPDLYSFHYIGDGESLAFSADSGEVWATRRKLAQNALKTFSLTSSPSSSCTYLEEHVSEEATSLTGKFQELMKEKGRFDPYRYVVVSVANVICAMCFGKRYDHDDQELLSIVNLGNEFGEFAASGNPADFIPILRYLPNHSLRNFKDLNKKMVDFLQKILMEHYRTFEKNQVRDITDSLIKHCQDKKLDENANIQLSDKKIVNVVLDLFGAGFDTVTTSLSWSLMYLVKYPEIQKKIQKELDTVIGRDRRPQLSDRSLLPYTEAFILESFRHSSFLPFTIPHSTTRATSLNGYYIPKGRCVFVNQWQINHDPELWEDPSTFRPERFLTEKGTKINKALSERVIMFGLGKRKCIGETIARWEVFLFLTTLLQQMEFSIQSGGKLDMSRIYGLTMKHPRCEHFQVRPRF